MGYYILLLRQNMCRVVEMIIMFTRVMFVVVGFSLGGVLFQRMHVLSALLALEGAVLGLAVYVGGAFGNVGGESYVMLVLLTLGACEACVGLALLVAIVRRYGRDYVSCLSVNKC